MADRNLGQAILDQGVRNENFFNGRLLTAGDLMAEQLANSQHHWQLGKAIGAGVACGLEVSLISAGATSGVPIVSVTSGLALNANGQAVALPIGVQLQLTRITGVGAVDRADLFEDCDRQGAGPDETGDGVYVLLVSATSAYQEQAPKREVGNANRIVGCGSRYVVEGVEFRLERVIFETLTGVGSSTRTAIAGLLDQPLSDMLRSRLRNWLAHVCLGTEEIFQTVSGTEGLLGFADDPFALQVQQEPFQSMYDRYGAIDALATLGKIAGCDVPLALVCWTRRGFQFLDTWAVRRPITPVTVQEPWPTIYGPRRDAESISGFLQFQDQVQELLLTATAAATIRATDWYAYLPAAGFLKVGPGGFVPATFFQGLDVTNATIEPAFVRLLLHDARFVEPMNLSAKPPVKVYAVNGHPDYVVFVRAEAAAPPEATPPPPPAGPTVGRAVIDIAIAPKDFEAVLADLEEIDVKDIEKKIGHGLLVDPKLIHVALQDAAGTPYPVKFQPSDHKPAFFGKVLDFGKLGRGRFVAENLPPGAYLATVTVQGFVKASQQKAVTAGATTTFAFKLKRAKPAPPPGRKPDPGRKVKADFIDTGYKDAHLIDKYAHVGWPPKGWEKIPPLPDPPDYFTDFMGEWADFFIKTHPGDPVDPGAAAVYVNPAYDPHENSDEPYAYVAFGAGGVYAPVVLTTTDYGVDAPVSASKAKLGGIDAETSLQLAILGLSVDVIAGSWNGLVEDTLGVATGTATGLVSEARDKSQGFIGSLQQFGGVDENLEQSMQDKGIDGPAALANAEASDLAGKLNISETFAQRLIDQAQGVVPASQWSLDAANLGFKSQELGVLAARGIESQGQLQAAFSAASDPEKAALASELGQSLAGFTVTVGAISVPSGAQLKAEQLNSASVTSVAGVSSANKGALLALNVKTVGDLAGMSAGAVAGAFGGDEAQAANVIAQALEMGNFH